MRRFNDLYPMMPLFDKDGGAKGGILDNSGSAGGQPNNDPSGGAGNGGSDTHWTDDIEAFKGNETLRGYDTQDAALQAHLDLIAKQPQVPVKPEEYTVPEGVKLPEASIKLWQDKMLELGLPVEKAQEWLKSEFESHQKHMVDSAEAAKKADAEQRTKVEAELRGEWKDSYDQNLEKATKAFETIFSEDSLGMIRETGINLNPQFVKDLHRLGSVLSQDAIDALAGQKPKPVANQSDANEEARLKRLYPSMTDK